MRQLDTGVMLLLCAVSWAAPWSASAGGVPPALSARLEALAPDSEPDHVAETPLPGLYEVRFGSTIVYVTGDGRYMLRGDLVDLETLRNVTERARQSARAEVIDGLGEAGMIVFAPGTVKHTVTVFTDVDCPYCVRLHRQMADYNRLGIKIRYTAFPRAGIPSSTYDKTVSVWCSADPHTAIGDAKMGRGIEPRRCANPVREHYESGLAIGVTGTPAIILESGRMVPGYVPPAELAQMLDEREPG